MQRPLCSYFIQACITRKRAGTKKTNVILILVTSGGNADVAYRIGSYLQHYYENVSVYVTGYCKSAGTLLALAGTELIVSDHGELGPLDVQMRKQNNLMEQQSGLDVMESLTALRDKAWLAFERSFIDIQLSSGGNITTESAGKMATDMAVGLFAPLIGKIDPMHIGEASRANSVALHYGKKLIAGSGNSDESNLERLVSDYPSHSFVIDRREAEKRFNHVRPPNEDEILLAYCLNPYCRAPISDFSDDDCFEFVNDTAEKWLAENSSDAEDGTQDDAQIVTSDDESAIPHTQPDEITDKGGDDSGPDDESASPAGGVEEVGNSSTAGKGIDSDEPESAEKSAKLQSI